MTQANYRTNLHFGKSSNQEREIEPGEQNIYGKEGLWQGWKTKVMMDE